jgi:photosystem II stability/assembly factor-like uncharacterized protein
VAFAYTYQLNKLWRTADRGKTWQVVTSSVSSQTPLPSTTIITGVVDDPLAPTTTWFVSTNDGIYKTTDGGNNWRLWKNGMPFGADVTRLTGTNFNGTFWVTAGLYGRGFWQRDASGDDP